MFSASLHCRRKAPGMPVPNHHPSCFTRMWQTRCTDCQASVYFFSCSCGTRVLFDSPGPPWPRHAEYCLPHFIRQRRGEGASAEAIERSLFDYAAERALKVPDSLVMDLRREGRIERAHTLFVEVVPNSARDFLGTVMAFDGNINVAKRYGLDQSAMSTALLGRLGEAAQCEIRLREKETGRQRLTAELTAYIPSRMSDEIGVRIGQAVVASVSPYSPPGRGAVWVVDEIMVRP